MRASNILGPICTNAVACAVAIIALSGCKDQAKVSETRAVEHVASLTALAEKDVLEVERGLPQGATQLEALVAKGDPKDDLAGVRAALKRVRRDVPDLNVAKSTFFALADADGVAIRNDLEQDVMAGQNLKALFPALEKATAGEYVTTTGSFPGAAGPAGPDKDWIAATPVRKKDGGIGAVLVTGWTFRSFARHLQESLRRELQDELQRAGSTKMPIVYVAVFDPSGAYTAPLTPPVNEKALADLGLVEKTAAGPAQGRLSITEREFGYAATRVPKLGPDTGIAVLRSEI
jgi:hypothetical protein